MTERLISPEMRDVAAVQAEHEQRLLALPNVVGVAVGHKYTGGVSTGVKCVSVLVDLKMDPGLLGKNDMVPAKVGSVPTDVIEAGVLTAGAGPAALAPDWADTAGRDREPAFPGTEEALAALPPREQLAALTWAARTTAGLPGASAYPPGPVRQRPVVGGMSIGHYRGAAGTLGICCSDATAFTVPASDTRPGGPSRFYLLSCNHVLANCNDAQPGDPILQPAPADGGSCPADTIARLARFVPIRFAPDRALPTPPAATTSGGGNGAAAMVPVNYADAAIAEGRPDQLDRRIHWIGDICAVQPAPQPGTPVQMCGRASHYTTGTIVAINATVHVNYPHGRTARFAKQIITTGLSAGGDSGALVTDLHQQAAGLLFATSPQVSICSPIPLVEHLLGIRITPPATTNNAAGHTR